ncbi:hypothetical protein JMN32_11695 [Fulvivirga sp. 29W222]|uniref:PKD/Chitinase domain-containing protein n=1 Tax=Fulvivirga marina TaxID=2494733 RepID=A0A937FXT7_9BACT|nr:hypothetical protein [Fulvivirga marina]MBL6446977.1 hypothetical protein [Fulvivirga marina]
MKLTITTFFILVSFVGFAQNSALKHNTVKTVALNKVQGYLEHLPPGYSSNPTKKYPLLIFLHGAGERGSTPADMYKVAKNGPPKEIENQGSLCFEVNGKQECFIVLSPQLTGSGNWTGYAQKDFWNYVLNGPNNYRYDPNRIYLTGLSLGGNGVWERAYDVENSNNNLAAIAPLCAWGNTSKGCIVAERNIPVWAFHGTSDDVIGFNSGISMFNSVNDCESNTQQNTFTAIQDGEHWIWNAVYKTDHSEYSPNVYEWLLAHTLNDSGSGGGGGSSTTNQPPVVDAGQDLNTIVGTESVSFGAVASDPDGSISEFTWTQVSGPTATMWNADRAKLTVADLAEGSYEFKITVTDNDGANAADNVLLTVETPSGGGGTTNALPTVNAGADVNASTTESAIYLIAQASDSDGSIASYSWKKISGPAVSLWNPDRSKLTLVNFVEGTYLLEITVQDNDGGQASDQVTVVVGGGSSSGGGDTSNSTATLKNKVSSDGMPYAEYLPSGYNTSEKYPVIIYLHSDAAEGTNLDLVKAEGPLYYANQGKEICANGQCFIVLSPQIEKGSGFWKGKVDRFYNYAVANYPVDQNRIFLVGFDGGAVDGLYRLMDGTNSPNRWAATAAISYSMPLSVACNIASSGTAFYMANSTLDEENNYNNALSFYNEVDGCTSNTTLFVTEGGNQEQSWKNSFDPEITNLYAWLLNQTLGTQASGARMSGEETQVVESNNLFEGNLANFERNFRTDRSLLSLTTDGQPVKIEVKSINGITIKQVNSNGEVTLDDVENGIYLYSIEDEQNNLLQRGRIVKFSR